MEATPADEHPHPPGDEADWAESWAFDFATPRREARELRGLVRVTLLPHRSLGRYLAYILVEGRPPVVVLDDEVPIPRNGSLEIRTEGLWADHVVEEPFDHVSVGLEAFGLAVEADEPVSADMWGDRVAVGLDLGWETDGAVQGGEPDSGYALPCVVVGEVLVGDERIQLDGHGWRSHRWGAGQGVKRIQSTATVAPGVAAWAVR